MESDKNNVGTQEKSQEEPVKCVKDTSGETKAKVEGTEQNPNENGVETAEKVIENGDTNGDATIEEICEAKDGKSEEIVDAPVGAPAATAAATPTETSAEAPSETSANTETAAEILAETPAEIGLATAAETPTQIKAEATAEVLTDVQSEAPVESQDVAQEENEKEIKSVETEAVIEEATKILEIEQSFNEIIENATEETEINEGNKLEEIPLKTESGRDQNELDPDILKRIENYLESIGVSDYTLKVEPHGQITDLFTRTFRIKINNSKTELNWLIRAAPPAESVRHMVDIGRFYQNEELIYRKLFPAYRKLEDEQSLVGVFDSYPKYHLSGTDFLKEFVVISDITQEFLEQSKTVGLKWHSVNLAMKAYGKLHALSYALKMKQPNLFSELSDTFKKNFAVTNEAREDQKAIFENYVLTTLDPIKEGAVHKKFSKLIQNLGKAFGDISTNEYSVIGYCCRQLAFSIKPNSRRNSICFLDFQNAKYASPACDLSHFLYCYTDKDFREFHYNSAIKLYYYTLCGHLNGLGYDPEKILPYEALEGELKRSSVVGLCIAILELAATFKDELNEPIFTRRVKDSIIDFNASGFFPNDS